MTSLSTTINRFEYEDMCCRGLNVLPISTVCNGSCMFCSNHMNPFPIYRCGFRTLTSVEEWIANRYTKLDSSTEIRLSDALPGRISEGEATLHPKFFEICKALRKKFSNPLHITTNASKLTKEFIERMAEFLPFNVMVSYHSTNVDHWTKLFGLEEKHYHIATASFKLMKEAGIGVNSAVVMLPSVVGYADIERTFSFLSEYSTSIQAWEPGYSKLASNELREKLHVDADEFGSFMDRMYKECPTVVVWAGDPLLPLEIPIVSILHETVKKKYSNVVWLTASGNYSRLERMMSDTYQLVHNNHFVVGVQNKTYGGNIRCNGLLMMSDIQSAIDSLTMEYDAIVIPDGMLDSFGRDLKGDSRFKLRTNANILWR